MCLSVRSDGKILLIKSSYRRLWALPGGFLELGEDPIAGALRELHEETGTTLQFSELLHSRTRKHHSDYLVAGLASPDQPLVASWEIAAADWVAPRDLNSAHGPLHPMTLQVLRYVPGGVEAYAQRVSGGG